VFLLSIHIFSIESEGILIVERLQCEHWLCWRIPT